MRIYSFPSSRDRASIRSSPQKKKFTTEAQRHRGFKPLKINCFFSVSSVSLWCKEGVFRSFSGSQGYFHTLSSLGTPDDALLPVPAASTVAGIAEAELLGSGSQAERLCKYSEFAAKKKFTTEARRAQRFHDIENTLFFLCVLCASVVQRGCFPIFLRITGILSHSRSLGTMKKTWITLLVKSAFCLSWRLPWRPLRLGGCNCRF